VNLRQFVQMTCPGVDVTEKTEAATLIQSRHRIPERPLTGDQIIVLQVPYPDALVVVEPSEDKRKIMHGEADYSRLLVKLDEDIVQFDEITISHRYPTRINGHYVIDPSPIPRWDVPKLHRSRSLALFGAGREKKIYAVPPHTDAEPLIGTYRSLCMDPLASLAVSGAAVEIGLSRLWAASAVVGPWPKAVSAL
jgi:alpha-D-ribose 1-methylphosphonate 5-phosphate C-P lyase